jgi:hypothetical protein
MNRPIQEHLLYNDIIEGDGRISHEPTFLGAAVAFTVFGLGIVAIIFLASFL